MDIGVQATLFMHEAPRAFVDFHGETPGSEACRDAGYGSMRWITAGPSARPARRFPGFTFIVKPAKPTGSM